MNTLAKLLAEAIQHHQAGRLPQAEQLYREILALDAEHAEALHLLGALVLQSDQHREAVELIDRAIAADPSNAAAYANLGVAHRYLGNFDEAEGCFRQAIQLGPTLSDAYNNLAILLREQGKPEEAESCYRQAIRMDPKSPEIHNNLSVLLQKKGNLIEAEACCRRALEIRPDYAEAHCNLAIVLCRQNRLEEAAGSSRRALEIRPEYAKAYNSLGMVLRKQRELEEAVACYRSAIRIDPEMAESHNNLALVLRDLGELEEALACCQRALEINPDYANAHNSLGSVLRDQGQRDEAVACFRRSIQLGHDQATAHTNLGIVLLSSGEFTAGWPEYQWRLRCDDVIVSPACQPLWDGTSLAGRSIMLFAEQGLGDTVHFIRYAELLKHSGAGEVLLGCQAPLVPLLKSYQYVDRLVPRGDPLPSFDVAAPLLSLPGIVGTTLQTIPAEVPYITPDAALVEQWRMELESIEGLKVGIAWQGNPDHRDDRRRSIPLDVFESLAGIDGVRLISLQKGPGTDQLQSAREKFPIINLGPRLDEHSGAFMDTAAVMQHLDLVITSDSAVAHLAGALGVPVWVVLSAVPDWRWLLDRDDSPWYPTMRLFRQQQRGDWNEVFHRIAEALQDRVAADGGVTKTPTPELVESIAVEVSAGELLDKLTILEIKRQRIDDPAKQRNIETELRVILEACAQRVTPSAKLDALKAELRTINEMLWEVEDEIRDCERQQDFGPRFVELARSVYRHNDQRSRLKRQINDLLGSPVIEEKSYAPYEDDSASGTAPLEQQSDRLSAQDHQTNTSAIGKEALLENGQIRLKTCRFGPMFYFVNDRYIGQSLDRYGEFSPGEYELFEQILRSGQTVLDIGANIGTHTVFFSQKVGPTGTVHAFEPQRVIFQILCGNVAINTLTNVHTHQVALGREKGTTQVPVVDYQLLNNFGGLSLSGSTSGEIVPVITIDQLELPACHLIKIDVEGMEAEVLAGAQRTIARLRPVLYLENDREEQSSPLIKQLLALDYRLYWHLPPLFNPKNYFHETENLFPGIISCNMLAIPRAAEQNIGMYEIHSPDDSWRSVPRR